MSEINQVEILAPRRSKSLRMAALALACLAAYIVVEGTMSRIEASRALSASTDAQEVPTVSVVRPRTSGATMNLSLPGRIRAFYQAPIYAQVGGYLERWYTDIGTRVKAGQLMALISTPGLDQQLARARANLATAVANQRLAAITARRWRLLLAQDAVSKQAADDASASLAAKTAAMRAARANVHRLQALEAFKRIVAPFDGVVTSRSTDIGALITLGNASQTPLFTVDDERRMRIYVDVPQGDSGEVRPGLTAHFTVAQYPGRDFTASVSSSAGALDPKSGTLLLELQTPNPKGLLQSGDFAQVRIALPADPHLLSVPSSTLIFDSSGTRVATVGPRDRVVLKHVSLGRDLGATVEITSGLTPADRVINDPPDWLEQGDRVHVAAPPATPAGNRNGGG